MDNYFELARQLIGKTIAAISDASDMPPPDRADKGLEIIFTDGSRLWVGFSGDEGDIFITLTENNAPPHRP